MSDRPAPTDRFCSRCGAELTPNATFCAKCGNPVGPKATSQGGSPPEPSAPPAWDRHAYREWKREQWRNEKYEKQEKGENHEKRSGGRISGPIFGALILIWLGITLYLEQINAIPSSNWWAYFLAGIGVIMIIQGIARYLEYRGPFVGSVIGGGALFLIGLFFIGGLSFSFWPLLLVVIGLALIASAFAAGSSKPVPASEAS